MKIYKKILNLLLASLLMVSCSSKGAEPTIEEKPTRTADLIDNINKHEEEINANKELDDSTDPKEETPMPEKKKEELAREDSDQPEKISSVTIKTFGDIMAHLIQTQYAYNKGAGSYDFSDSFAYVKDYISDADIAIGNYETTTNPNLAYAGYPRFNTPIEYIKALDEAGFDVLTTANNHSLDTELEGLYSTIDAMDEVGISHVGSQKQGEDKILYKNVNGIKIAFLAYTYGANGRVDLVKVREEVAELNYLHEEGIKADIKQAKSNGADFVVVYPHWGIEYQTQASQSQIDLGRQMLEWGADLVIGNHPHVVQPYEYYETNDGRDGFIAYALGNFISFQNLENNNNIRTEQSVSYEITLNKNQKTGQTSIGDIKANPIWVGVKYNEFGQSIQSHMAIDFLEDGKYYDQLDEYQRARVKQAYDMTLETIGNKEKNE